MRRRMPVNFQRLGIAILEQAQIGIFFEWLGQVDEIAIGFRDECGVGEPQADGLRDVERGGACGNFLHAAVGELHMNAVCHKVGAACSESLSLWEQGRRVKPKAEPVVSCGRRWLRCLPELSKRICKSREMHRVLRPAKNSDLRMTAFL